MFSRIVAVALASLTLLGSGMMCQSLATDSAALDVAVARMNRVPLEIGDWKAQATEDDKAEERSFEQAGAKGYWMRSYANQRTHSTVLVILMCGRAGKMAVHTPEICYRGAGFEMLEQPAVCIGQNELAEEAFRFWTARFTKKTNVTTNLRLYWAWSTRGVWEAAPNPRWQYRGEPYLYKLYVARELGSSLGIAPQEDPAANFLRQFLPELNAALFAPSNPT